MCLSRHNIVQPFLISSAILSRNIRAALELTNIVADSRYKLYYDFISDEENKLGTYLRAVRAAVLAGLEVNAGAGNGGGTTATTSDPFRIMVS